MFYWILFGEPAFCKDNIPGRCHYDLARQVVYGQWSIPERFRNKISIEALQIIQHCLVHDPDNRISFEGLNTMLNEYLTIEVDKLTPIPKNHSLQFSTHERREKWVDENGSSKE